MATNVLVLEDQEITSMDIELCLKSHGYIVELTSNYDQAVAKTETFSPDLLLADILLKDSRDGIETAKRLRKEFVNLPVIFLTAVSDLEIFNRIKNMDSINYLIKPFQKANLIMAIRLALEKSKQGNNFENKKMQIIHNGNSVQVTPRELEIMHLVSMGLTSEKIANKLYISVHTVNTHRRNLLSKIGIKNAAELIQVAIANNAI